MIEFKSGTQAEYNNATKDENHLYFVKDSQCIYKGSTLVANAVATETGSIGTDHKYHEGNTSAYMNGTYAIFGDVCLIWINSAELINGWGEMWYPLPKVAVNTPSVYATSEAGQVLYISIDARDMSCVNIHHVNYTGGSDNTLTNSSVTFTLAYRWR